jgi:hypothetical protein
MLLQDMYGIPFGYQRSSGRSNLALLDRTLLFLISSCSFSSCPSWIGNRRLLTRLLTLVR